MTVEDFQSQAGFIDGQGGSTLCNTLSRGRTHQHRNLQLLKEPSPQSFVSVE
jgi:hypothetical protein